MLLLVHRQFSARNQDFAAIWAFIFLCKFLCFYTVALRLQQLILIQPILLCRAHRIKTHPEWSACLWLHAYYRCLAFFAYLFLRHYNALAWKWIASTAFLVIR